MEVYAGEENRKELPIGYEKYLQAVRPKIDWVKVSAIALCLLVCITFWTAVINSFVGCAAIRAVDRPSSVLSPEFQRGRMDANAKAAGFINYFYGEKASKQYYEFISRR
jgi:hypothetical protein